MHFFDRHNHKLQIEDFELFIALLERLMAEQIRKQSAQVTTKFQRGNDGYLLFLLLLWYWIIFQYYHYLHFYVLRTRGFVMFV